LRVFLLGSSIFIFTGTLLELLALRHYREELQWIPLVLSSLGIVLVASFLVKPGRSMIRVIQIGMGIIATGGLFGTIIHISGNLESLVEAGRMMNLQNLFYTIAGGRNPLLAPGILTIAAALSLAAVYRHPAGEALQKKDK
jgi:preprotein translocase subunit YajC